MANSNVVGNNRNPETANPETHVPQPKRTTILDSIANREAEAEIEDTLAAIGSGLAAAIAAAIEDCAPDREAVETPALDTWAANPEIERTYVRFDISCQGLSESLPLILDFLTACGCANVDSGHSVYGGHVEDRVSVTLFDVTLQTAFGYFAELRSELRANLYPLDCGRFYFDSGSGSEVSLCAKRVAPYWVTLAAGLSTTQTQTERTAYAYTVGPNSSVSD